jgi:4-aminobutyrate aminotransferase-like enzyme
MLGIECSSGERALQICQAALRRGLIVLPSGPGGCVLSITPPLSIGERALSFGIDTLVLLASSEVGEART